MTSTVSKNNISKFQSIKKTFLWTAVYILIGELILGALAILSQGWTVETGKIQLTFFLIALVLFIGINNFIMMEKDNAIVRWSAIVCFVGNLVWLALAMFMIWEIVSSSVITLKILSLAADIAFTGFWVSNVLNIEETVAPVKPLKITSIVCELYCFIYALITILNDDFGSALDPRWGALSGLAGFAFIVTAVIAAIISRVSAKKHNISAKDIVNNSEVQSTIQDLVEKEVQARLAAQGVTPTSNDDSVQSATPTSKHDSAAQAASASEHDSGSHDDSSNTHDSAAQMARAHSDSHHPEGASNAGSEHVPKRDLSAIYPDVKKEEPPEIHPSNDSDSGNNPSTPAEV